jgi:cytochrome d ubiquinol oxidase subunit II
MNFDMSMQLPLIWMALIVGLALLYVVMGSASLGVGILLPLIKNQQQRAIMLKTRKLWPSGALGLVLASVGLLWAFPQACMILLSALYFPFLILLLSLITCKITEKVLYLSVSSWMVAFMQGVLMGAMLQGLPLENELYVGGFFGWATFFSFFCGLIAVIGYGVLGASWLIMQTTGDLEKKCFDLSKRLLGIWIGLIGVVSVFSPWINKTIALRWFTLPNLAYLAPLPIYTFIFSVIFLFALKYQKKKLPFACALMLLILFFIEITVTVWPYAVPYEITIWQAAAPLASQSSGLNVMLGGVLIMVSRFFLFRSGEKA